MLTVKLKVLVPAKKLVVMLKAVKEEKLADGVPTELPFNCIVPLLSVAHWPDKEALVKPTGSMKVVVNT